MRFPSQVRSLPQSRFVFPTILAIAIGVLTTWVTLTGYTASRSRARATSSDKNPSSTTSKGASHPSLDKSYGQLPLGFEANQGQTSATSKYVARGPGYNIFLAQNEAVLVFRGTAKEAKENDELTAPDEDQITGVERLSRQRALSRPQELDESREGKPTVLRIQL